MDKFLNWLERFGGVVIITASLIAYFAYKTMSFEGSIETTLKDPHTWIHILFVVSLHQVAISYANTSALSYGMKHNNYVQANELNNKVIIKFNRNQKYYRQKIRNLNKEELERVRDDYLFKIGDKTYEEMTKREKRKYNKLKAITHDIYAFNHPLNQTTTRGKRISYVSSVKNETTRGIVFRRIKKIGTGILFGAMTISMSFKLDNVGDAFVSMLIIAVGVFFTYLLTFLPLVYKITTRIPERVLTKNALIQSLDKEKVAE